MVVSMYEKAASLVPAEAPRFAQARLESAFAMVGVAAYTWLKSFRRRWHAKVGKIEIGTDLSQEELQRKAGLLPPIVFHGGHRLEVVVNVRSLQGS